MKSVFRFFLENSKLTFVLTIGLLVMGLMGFKNLRRETRPAVDFARVIISTFFPGSSSKEVEEQITLKVEEQIRAVDGIVDSRSISAPGMSSINLRIDIDNEDTKEIVDELQRSLFKVKNLPSAVLDPPYLQHIKAKEIPLLNIVITGDNSNRRRDELTFQLKTVIEKDPGAAHVHLKGYQPKEFQITLDPQKLIDQHIAIEEVVQAVQNHTKDFSAGSIRSKTNIKQVQFLGKTETVSQLENLVVRSNFSGQKILLKDLAQVISHQEDPVEMIRFKGHPVTYLMVTKKEKEDSIKLSDRIEKLIQSYPMPAGYTVEIHDNEAERTKNQLSVVANNAWAGLGLVLLVLILLLPGWLGVMSAVSLPISILGTVAICSYFDITFNTITMLSLIICIGMLVDNAVVVSENYARLRLESSPPKTAALNSVFQLYKPITATVLTTISAFLPMLATKGVMGQFIMWIPIVICVSLMVSLFDAFFLLPSRLQLTIRKTKIKTTKIQSYFNILMDRFEKCIRVCLKRRYLVFFSLIGLVFFSLSINFWGNQFILFPKSDVRHYSIYYEAEEGMSIEKTDALTPLLIEKIIQTTGLDQIEGLMSQTGNKSGFFSKASSVAGEHNGEMYLLLKRNSIHRTQSEALLKKLRSIDPGPFKVLQFEARAGGPPVGNAVHVIFTSNDRQQLISAGEYFKKEISKLKGVLDVEDDQVSTGPEYRVLPNHKKLAELKLSPLSLGRTLQMALQGAIAGEFTDKGENFYVRVYYDDQARSNIENLKQTKILSPAGSLISLGEVITVEDNPKGSKLRKRYGFQPSLEVTAKVNADIINSEKANTEAEKILKSLLKKYPNISYEFAGERKHTRESMQSLFQAMVIAVFGIFAILLLLFRSFMVSFLALGSISLGLIGVSIAFALHQKPLSFLALIGVVGLAGVTINSAIILVSFIEKMRKAHPEKPLMNVLAESARYRFKPIVITTFTTVLGLFPAAYGLGGSEYLLIPMTLAFTWGLTTGSLLTLFWIPCGYAIVDDMNRWFSKRFKKFLPKEFS